MARLRAPAGGGEVLAVPDFDAVPALVEENRRRLDRTDVVIGGMPLRELRALARREVLDAAEESGSFVFPSPLAGEGGVSLVPSSGARQELSPPGEGESSTPPVAHPSPADLRSAALSRKGRGREDGPLVLAGHQPELSHPGVWVKNFAINGLAKKLGGFPVNLIVDNDTLKSTSLRFPVFRDRDPTSVHLQPLAFDTFAGEVPYEDRTVLDAEQFRTFPDRAAPLCGNWGYEPLLGKVWRTGRNVGETFTAMRRRCERDWDCWNAELSVSRLSQSDAFARFACHILGDLPRFRAAYNAAIRSYRESNGIRSRNHPAPELGEGEAPFWVHTAAGRRERATPTSDVRNLRPRALTLTLFARVCLGDFFIHGIGGGKYDEVTDTIIRDYFGIEPPAYQVLSATLHLPLPGCPSTVDDLRRAERHIRELHWNPQRHLPPGTARELVERKAALAANEPPRTDRAARKAWFRELQGVNQRLWPFVADLLPAAEATLERVRAEVAANEILRRRDYSWVLYPEETLRPFLQRFLTV